MRLLLLLLLLPILSFSLPNLQVINKDGSTSDFSIDAISKITFENDNMVIAGPAQTFSLSTIRKVLFITSTTGVETALPSDPFVCYAYPNPFNPSINFDLAIPENGRLQVDIFNCQGQKVKNLIKADVLKGRRTLNWNCNAGSDVAASGFYLLRMEFNGKTFYKKLILAK